MPFFVRAYWRNGYISEHSVPERYIEEHGTSPLAAEKYITHGMCLRSTHLYKAEVCDQSGALHSVFADDMVLP